MKIIYVIVFSILVLSFSSNAHALIHPETAPATAPVNAPAPVIVPTPIPSTETQPKPAEPVPVVPATPIPTVTEPKSMPAEPTMTKEMRVKEPRKPVDIVCMQNAVEARDNAIIVAFDKYATSGKMELEKRKTELKSAWAISDHKTRKEAIHKTWKIFREAKRELTMSMKKDVQEAWKQFNTERKKCYNGSEREIQKLDPTTSRVDF